VIEHAGPSDVRPSRGMQSTVEFPFDCRQMFDLVADIERYPDFVPGWQSVEICGRSESKMEVRQVVQVAGFQFAFESVATLERPRRIMISARKGVFDVFEIVWQFDGGARGCRVTLETNLALRSRLLQTVSVPVLARQHREIVCWFEREAKQRYEGG